MPKFVSLRQCVQHEMRVSKDLRTSLVGHIGLFILFLFITYNPLYFSIYGIWWSFQHIYRGKLIFFSVKSNFYFTEWTSKAIFSRVATVTSENTSFGVHEWNKNRSYTEKQSVSFMLLCTIIKLLPALRLSRQKTNFFSSHLAIIWSY